MSEVSWPGPSAEDARFYASAVEAGVPGEFVIGALLPEWPVERREPLAERWERTREVRAARFDVRAWLEQSSGDRMQYALEKTRNSMAAYLAMTNIADLKDAALNKALKFMDALEKVVAGTAGKGDASSQFFADVMSGKIKLQASQPERVQ